jgi:hypothetical protein
MEWSRVSRLRRWIDHQAGLCYPFDVDKIANRSLGLAMDFTLDNVRTDKAMLDFTAGAGW